MSSEHACMPAAGCAPKRQTLPWHRCRPFFAIGEARIRPSNCVRPADKMGLRCLWVSLFGVLHRFTARGHWVKHACRLVTGLLHTHCVRGLGSYCVSTSQVLGLWDRSLCGFPWRGVLLMLGWCVWVCVPAWYGCWHACRPLQLHLLCALRSLLFCTSGIHAAPP